MTAMNMAQYAAPCFNAFFRSRRMCFLSKNLRYRNFVRKKYTRSTGKSHAISIRIMLMKLSPVSRKEIRYAIRAAAVNARICE